MVFKAVVRRRDGIRSACRSCFGTHVCSALPTAALAPRFSRCDSASTIANRRRRRPTYCNEINRLHAMNSTTPPSSLGCQRSRHLSGKATVLRPTVPSMPDTSRSHEVPIHAHEQQRRLHRQSPRPSPCAGAPGSNSDDSSTSNVDNHSLVLRMMGPRWSPYGRLARIDKPAGALLLTYPCWWGAALATPMGSFPSPWLLTVFATSAFVMRSAGCTINDMWDRDLDRKVARTQSRPLASGELNTAQALAFLGAQLGVGLCGLLTLNVECIKLGFAAMPLVIIYPLMKRCTDWPQAVLGLTFNWGAIVGWTAVHGSVSWPHVLPLYTAGVCWTLVYDTLYGHQDKKDDKKLGIRSTALLFGENTKPILAGFGAASVGLIGVAGYTTGLSWPFYVGTVLAAGHLARQVGSADLEDPEGLFRIFRSNHEFGALAFASIVAGHWQF